MGRDTITGEWREINSGKNIITGKNIPAEKIY